MKNNAARTALSGTAMPGALPVHAVISQTVIATRRLCIFGRSAAGEDPIRFRVQYCVTVGSRRKICLM